MKTLEIPNAKRMKKLGFTNHREGFWYFVKGVGDSTTFNLTINRETGSYEAEVLNEFFLQPEYYGHMKPVYRDEIVARVNAILHKLAEQGLEVEFDHAEYGVRSREMKTPFEPHWGMVIGYPYEFGIRAVYLPNQKVDRTPWLVSGYESTWQTDDWAKQKLAEGWVVIEKPEGVK